MGSGPISLPTKTSQVYIHKCVTHPSPYASLVSNQTLIISVSKQIQFCISPLSRDLLSQSHYLIDLPVWLCMYIHVGVHCKPCLIETINKAKGKHTFLYSSPLVAVWCWCPENVISIHKFSLSLSVCVGCHILDWSHKGKCEEVDETGCGWWPVQGLWEQQQPAICGRPILEGFGANFFSEGAVWERKKRVSRFRVMATVRWGLQNANSPTLSTLLHLIMSPIPHRCCIKVQPLRQNRSSNER